MANSIDPDKTLRSSASDLGLHCLLRPVCPDTLGRIKLVMSRQAGKSVRRLISIEKPNAGCASVLTC